MNNEVVSISQVDRLTAELESLNSQIARLEGRRREVIWERNNVLAENASMQTDTREVRHYGGIPISRS